MTRRAGRRKRNDTLVSRWKFDPDRVYNIINGTGGVKNETDLSA